MHSYTLTIGSGIENIAIVSNSLKLLFNLQSIFVRDCETENDVAVNSNLEIQKGWNSTNIHICKEEQYFLKYKYTYRFSLQYE